MYTYLQNEPLDRLTSYTLYSILLNRPPFEVPSNLQVLTTPTYCNFSSSKMPPIPKPSSEYTIPTRAIVSYSQHDWRWEDLLTRAPREDEFLVEMIATGVCHTDISGYGGIYPRVYGHEGTCA